MPPTTPANNTSPGNVPTPSPLPSELLLTTGSSLAGSFPPDLRLQTQQQNSAAPQPGLPGDSLRDQARAALSALKGGRPPGRPASSVRLVYWGTAAALLASIPALTFWGVKSGEHKPTPVEVKPEDKTAAALKTKTGSAVAHETPKTNSIGTPTTVEKKESRSSLGGDMPRPSKRNEAPAASTGTTPAKDLAAGLVKSPGTKPPENSSLPSAPSVGETPKPPSREETAPAKPEKMPSGDLDVSVDRQEYLTHVRSALHIIGHYLHGVAPKSSQPEVFDPTEVDFSDAQVTECLGQFLEALDKLPFRYDAKFELTPPLAELKKGWAEDKDKDTASKKFYSQVTKFLGDDALVSLPPLDWTPKKKPVVTDPSPSAPEPPKVVGTVSPEITEAGKRMNYFLFQINRSISQARLTPPKLKLDSAESILQTLTDINFCLTQMQLSDVKQVAVDGYNFGKIIQEVGSAWSMGVDKGLAAVEKLFPRVEE